MRVSALLIEAFDVVDETSVSAEAVLCRLDKPTYVGVRRTEGAPRIGPAAVVEPNAQLETTLFPRRLLPIEGGHKRVFSHNESWTVPAWTLYLVAPPVSYVADLLRIEMLDTANVVRVRPAVDNDALYYYALVQGSADQEAFEVEARFKQDSRAVQAAAARAGRVPHRPWQQLWASVAVPLSAAGDVASVAAVIRSFIG